MQRGLHLIWEIQLLVLRRLQHLGPFHRVALGVVQVPERLLVWLRVALPGAVALFDPLLVVVGLVSGVTPALAHLRLGAKAVFAAPVHVRVALLVPVPVPPSPSESESAIHAAW